MWAQWLSTNSCLQGWALPAPGRLCLVQLDSTRGETLLAPLSKCSVEMTKTQNKNQTLEAVTLPAPWFRMMLLFPPHSNVCLWKMSPFPNSSLSVKEPSSAGEIQLYQGIQPPCAFKAAGGAG